MPKKYNPFKNVKNISVSDEEVISWMKTLKEQGISNEEIDTLMSHLNATYKQKLRPNFVEQELEKIKQKYREKHGRTLKPEEIEYFRKGLEMRRKEK